MPSWQIEYNETAQVDLLAIDKPVRLRILKFFRERVATHPEPKAIATALEGEFRGLHRFRIGDHRAVCHIQSNRLIVLVLIVDHRRAVYKRTLSSEWMGAEGS